MSERFPRSGDLRAGLRGGSLGTLHVSVTQAQLSEAQKPSWSLSMVAAQVSKLGGRQRGKWGSRGGSPIPAQQHQLLQVGTYTGVQAHVPLGACHLPALPTKQDKAISPHRPHRAALTKFSVLPLGGCRDGLSPSKKQDARSVPRGGQSSKEILLLITHMPLGASLHSL